MPKKAQKFNFKFFLKPALRLVAAFIRGLDPDREGFDDNLADTLDQFADGVKGDLNDLAKKADLATKIQELPDDGDDEEE